MNNLPKTYDKILINARLYKPISTADFSKYRVSLSAERIFAISFSSIAIDSPKMLD